MSLVETDDTKQTKIDDVSEEMSSVSQHEEASVDTEKGMQGLLIIVSVISFFIWIVFVFNQLWNCDISRD
jgi:hypothetical protein